MHPPHKGVIKQQVRISIPDQFQRFTVNLNDFDSPWGGGYSLHGFGSWWLHRSHFPRTDASGIYSAVPGNKKKTFLVFQLK